jgi:hypothetical protein
LFKIYLQNPESRIGVNAPFNEDKRKFRRFGWHYFLPALQQRRIKTACF